MRLPSRDSRARLSLPAAWTAHLCRDPVERAKTVRAKSESKSGFDQIKAAGPGGSQQLGCFLKLAMIESTPGGRGTFRYPILANQFLAPFEEKLIHDSRWFSAIQECPGSPALPVNDATKRWNRLGK
jgi:hypothetical protein